MILEDFSIKKLNLFVTTYTKEISIGIGLVLAAISGIYFYNNYRIQNAQTAQLAFSQDYIAYKKAFQDPEQWPNVELVAKTNYRQHARTSLGPYFLSLEAQALVNQNKLTEALQVLKHLLDQLSVSSPFYYLFKLQSVLIKLDVEDEATQNEGFKELETLAHDTKNTQRDAALYYLGNYYFMQNDFARARSEWGQLISQFPQHDVDASPWVMVAQEKMQQLPS